MSKENMRKIETKKKYFNLKDCEAGDVLVKKGKFLGEEKKENKFGKKNYLFREENGTVISLSPNGSLKYIVESELSVGDVVRIEYAGVEKLSKGKYAGKQFHTFNVFVEESEVDALDDTEEAIEEELEEEEEVTTKKAKTKTKKSNKKYDLDELDA